MITERDETLRIQGTSVRDESEVWILDGYFYKKMTENELDAYVHLGRYSTQLEEEANIIVPKFLGSIASGELFSLRNAYNGVGRSVSEDLYKISMLNAINYKDIEEKFGYNLDYTPDDFDRLFKSLSNMRRIISDAQLTFPEDYESSAPELITKSKSKVDEYIGVDNDYPLSAIKRSQLYLEGTVQKIAHRDLNWSNMGISRTSNELGWNLEIADWGSFGFAFAGYDEGRLFTRLSLNQDMQDIYLSRLLSNLNSNINNEEVKKFLVSFWRTVVVRSHREIHLTVSGRYEKPVNFKYGIGDENIDKKVEFYQSFIESHKNLIKKGVDNLDEMI